MEDYLKFAKKYLWAFVIIFVASSLLAIRCHWWFFLGIAVPSGIGTWLCLRIVMGRQTIYIEKKPKPMKPKQDGEGNNKAITAYDIFCIVVATAMVGGFIMAVVFYHPETFWISVWSAVICIVAGFLFSAIITRSIIKGD